MKKSLYLFLLLPVVLLAGCAKTNNTDSSQVHNSPDEWLGVADCDNYVDYMSCIADSMGDAGKATRVALEKTVSAWSDMPKEQLEQICQAAINGVTQVLDLYRDYNCQLEWVPMPVVENEEESNEDLEAENLDDALDEELEVSSSTSLEVRENFERTE